MSDCCARAVGSIFRPYYTNSLTRANTEDTQKMQRIATIIKPTCQAVASVFTAYAEILGIDGYRQAQYRFRQTVRESLLHLLEGCVSTDELRNDKIWDLSDQLGLDLHRWGRKGAAERSRDPGATRRERETRLREEGRLEEQRKTAARRAEDEATRRAEMCAYNGGWFPGQPFWGGGPEQWNSQSLAAFF